MKNKKTLDNWNGGMMGQTKKCQMTKSKLQINYKILMSNNKDTLEEWNNGMVERWKRQKMTNYKAQMSNQAQYLNDKQELTGRMEWWKSGIMERRKIGRME